VKWLGEKETTWEPRNALQKKDVDKYHELGGEKMYHIPYPPELVETVDQYHERL